eukprot:gene48422-64964_t
MPGVQRQTRRIHQQVEHYKQHAHAQGRALHHRDVAPEHGVHQRVAELGGHLRTGLEDTFYLPDGAKADSNGLLIEKLAEYARNAGREVASPPEARRML